MSKRRLTQQQARRVARGQRQSADRAEQTIAPGDGELGPEQTGLVIAHYGRELDLESATAGSALVRCRLRSNIEPLVTGDQVVWRPELATANGAAPTGVVVAGLPRRSLLTRPDSHSGQPRPTAANLDRMAVVIAPRPEPFANLIDRYLVAAELLGIGALLVLNKCDLNEAAEPELTALLNGYQALGYPTLRASTVGGNGLDAVRAALRGHTSILVGQSGVGKSSLIGALLPGIDIRVGALSAAADKGRHTTTTARLFHLPEGGDLIDSPGIREFGLGHFDRDDIAAGFVELQPWLGRCRFRDCRHGDEPDCALRAALAEGAISPARLKSYHAIVASLDR